MKYRIKIYGIVQGVGFRPFIDKLAKEHSIKGTVANKGSYVEVIAECEDVDRFIEEIKLNSPPRSKIIQIEKNIIADSAHYDDFKIIDSEHEVGDIFVSPDIAICEKCKAELFDVNNRRYLQPFINCTDCGPRLTIMKRMPYDRERTSMKSFEMCGECAEEYYDSTSRRYDAQPICCNECGPEIYILDGEEYGEEAIKKVRRIIKAGGIALIKGIGGFHLACDANNYETVERLRRLKHRPMKPFAVMSDIECVKYNEQCPVTLIDKSKIEVAKNVAPNNHKVGVMRPYTPLHLLIFNYPDDIKEFPKVLVMTSGNISGEPLAINDEQARELSKLCDVILSHNREILIRADDSVVDEFDSEEYMIRRSRGYAPLPIHCHSNKRVLAIGGELKNTFCLSKNNLYYLSPYIGDLTSLRTVEALKKSIKRMKELFEIEPEVVACDLHPRYQSTKIAEEISNELQIPLIKVQHHYAHILSCMAENDYNGEVIGVSFDGTGYGEDGSIWGGEFLIANPKEYKRVESISEFKQAGGDKSSVESWRNAISMIYEVTKDFELTKELSLQLKLIDEDKVEGQIFLLKNEINCIKSTSAGRLFDAVSAMLNLCRTSTFEGEAAMTLQYYAEESKLKIKSQTKLTTLEIFKDILQRRLNGESNKDLALDFHIMIARYITLMCERLREEFKIETVALSGGVFQNTLLMKLVIENLHRIKFKVLRHKMIPPNDGGIALGQALKANNN